MITLAAGVVTLELHGNIFWVNEFSEPYAKEDTFADLDGTTCVQRAVLNDGQTVTLIAKGSETRARSYWTRAQIEQIRLWEVSGEIITFTYGSKVEYLRVPPNPFSVTPLRDMEGHTATDIYYGSINFARVTQ